MNNLYKKGVFLLLTVLGLVILVETAILIKQHRYIRKLTNTIPFLMPGEEISAFDLTGFDNRQVRSEHLEEGKLSLVFIFEQPCSSCNKNLVYWSKLAHLAVKREIQVFGIVLDDPSGAFNIFRNKHPGFDIFIPAHRKEFIQQFRLRLPFAQTLLLKGKQLITLKVGNIGGNDLMTLAKRIEAILSGGKGD